MKLISKKEAKNKGLKRFFTGNPCKRGHVAERIVRTGDCLECVRLRSKRRYDDEGGRYHKKYYTANREKRLAYQKQKQKGCANYYNRQKEWRESNVDKIKQYRTERANLYAFHASRRRRAAKRATPTWFEYEPIKALYEQSPDGSEVHHIVPLQSCRDVVSGIHCAANLIILTKAQHDFIHARPEILVESWNWSMDEFVGKLTTLMSTLPDNEP